ncbi:MAG: hypothetical protein OSB21_00325, partial [Myxococcota bacterium]|nr:hypothetical protein [Myxococcota bacterium]
MPQLASIRALVGAVLLTTLSLGGCSCDPAASSIVGLAYVAPNPGSRIQLSDDLDPATAGVQVLVRLRAVGLNKADSGASVSLRNTSDVDASAVTGSVTINEQGIGVVSFENFTLVSGSNQLEATLSHGFGSDLLTKASFSVVAPGGPTCRFTAAPNGPAIASGVTLSEDLDLINAGFQTHIGVSCAGEGVVDGLTVGLNIAGAAGALDTTLSGGSAVFSSVNLPEGAVRLTTYLLLNQDQAATANVEFTVDTGRCDVAVDSPLNGVAILVSDDVDDSTPSIADVDVVVSSSRCGEGSTVSIAIGGESFDGQVGADGSASLRIELPQSASVSDFQIFDVIVADVSGTRNQGASLRQSHLVDTIAPALEIVGLAVDGSSVLTASDDQDANPLDELTYRLQVRATNFADVDLVFASVDDDDASAVSSPLTDLGIATFDIRLAAGQRSIRVYTNDAAGNPGEDLRSLTVDITVPVVTLLQPAQSGAVLAASDADTDLPGFQVDCAVSVANFSTIAALEPLVFCELQTLAENGDPTGPWVRSATASPEARDGDVGIGGIRLTLPDGFWGIRAGAITRNGTGNEAAPSAALNLQVDGTAPTITFASPTEGVVLNAGNAAIELIVSDAEEGQSVTLSANGGPAFDPAPTVDGNGRVLVEGLTWADQDGPVTLTADVSDRAGNPAVQASVSLRVDATPPGISLVGLDGSSAGAARDIVADGTLNATQNIRLDWGADLSNGLQYGFNVIVTNEALGQVVSLRINGSVINGATVDVGGNHVASFTNNDLGYTLLEGENSVSATVVDPAGNTRTVDALVSVTTGQPFVRILTPNDGAFVNTTTVNVTASSNAAEGAACRLVARLAGQPDINGSAVAAARGALDFGELELLIDGAWALTASCPFAGRDPVDSALSSINIDTRPPQLSFTGIPQVNGANVYTLADPADSTQGNRYRRHITVSAAANGACTLEGINPSALLTVTGGGVDLANIQRTSFSPGDACSFTFDAIALADEVNDASSSVTLAVSVNDLAGNTGTANAAVLVDRVGPSLVISSPANNAQLSTDDDADFLQAGLQYRVSATISGAAAGSNIGLYDGNNLMVEATVESIAPQFPQVTFNPDGPHSLQIRGADSYGNMAQSAVVNIVTDANAPVVNIFRPWEDRIFGIDNDANPQLAGYQVDFIVEVNGVDAGAVLILTNDAQNELGRGTINGPTVSVSGILLGEGQQTINASTTDGINSASDSVNVVIDLS